MYDRDNNGRFVRFDSWSDLLSYAARTPKPHWHGTDGIESSREPHGDAWHGTKTFDEAIKIATEGWTEGEAKIRDLTERMTARLLSGIVREDWRFDVEGSTFDVARYVEGEPEHWIAPDEAFEHGVKTVRVVVNLAASAGIDSKRLEQRGIAAAALVEALTFAGIKVELWAVRAVTADGRNSNRVEQHVLLKNADQPVEPARVAFAFAHPAMLRRLLHSANLQCDTVAPNSGLGIPSDVTDWQTGEPLKNDDGTVYLQQMRSDNRAFDSVESTERWIFDTLATYGVQIRGINAD